MKEFKKTDDGKLEVTEPAITTYDVKALEVAKRRLQNMVDAHLQEIAAIDVLLGKCVELGVKEVTLDAIPL